MLKLRLPFLVLLPVLWMLGFGTLFAQVPQGEPYIVNRLVGDVIDAQERAKYGLFPDIEGFQSAAFFKLMPGSYLIQITRKDSVSGKEEVIYWQRGEDFIRKVQMAIVRREREMGNRTILDIKPPLEPGRVAMEMILGGAGAFVGTIIPIWLISGESFEGSGSFTMLISVLGMNTLGSALGVWLVGSAGEQTGSFPITLVGSTAGMLVAVILSEVTNGLSFLVVPPLGAVIAFNQTRRYDSTFAGTSSLFHYRNGAWNVGYPAVQMHISPSGSGALVGRISLVEIHF